MCSQVHFPGVAIVFWHFLSWNYVNNIAKSSCVLLSLACCHSTSSNEHCRGLCPGLAVTGDSKRFIPSWALFHFIRSDLYPPKRQEVICTSPRRRCRQWAVCFSFPCVRRDLLQWVYPVSPCQATAQCIHLLTQTCKYWSGRSNSWSLPL